MRNILIYLVMCALCAPAFAAPKKLELKGQAKWLSDAPVERIEGTAVGKGTLDIDLDQLSNIKGKIAMPVASMKSGNDTRDEHLRGGQWLEADKYPEITFEISAVKVTKPAVEANGVKEAQVEATGKFTLHGVSTDLTAPATLKWKGDKVKVETAFKVELAKYAVKGKEGVVGNKVGKEIDVQVTLKGVAK